LRRPKLSNEEVKRLMKKKKKKKKNCCIPEYLNPLCTYKTEIKTTLFESAAFK
jgi:hypothetical protein